MTNLFKHGLVHPHKVKELYNQSIKDTINTLGVPKNIIKQVFKIQESYYCRLEEKTLSDEDKLWYSNLVESCNGLEGNGRDLPLPLKNMWTSGSAIKQFRRHRNSSRSKEGLIQSTKNAVISNVNSILSAEFPRTSGERCLEVLVGSKSYPKGFIRPEDETGFQPSYKANFGLAWVKKVYDKGLATIQSGKRKVLTILLEHDPYQYLTEDGIDCYKGSFLDIRFKHRGSGEYGYKMTPESLEDYCLLIKETDNGKVYGIGQSISKAMSLLERRQNAKVMKSLMENEL